MKKILTMVLALMLTFSVSAFAAEDEDLCLSCDKESCALPELCNEGEQTGCALEQPCNVMINICQCGTDFWKDADEVGVQVTSLTEGVYFTNQGGISVRLFRTKTSGYVSVSDSIYESDWVGYEWTNTYNTDNGASLDYWGAVASLTPDLGDLDASVTFFADGACDFLDVALYDTANVSYGTAKTDGDYYDPTGNGVNFTWANDEVDYFDADGDQILNPENDYMDCTLSANSKIDMVQTQKDIPWVLDVNESNGDTDGDGMIGEDKGDYLIIRMPTVAVDWAEVEAAGLAGTTAQAKVCILDVAGATSGLCSDCDVICCCTVDLVSLCPESLDNCIYYPYALYGQTEAGWSTGVVVSNISLAGSSGVSIADMSVDFTIIDQTGAVFTGTYADFTKAIQSFTVDSLIDDMLGLTGVAPGNVYIKLDSNFAIDGYEFNLLNNGSMTFGAGVLPRPCSWPAVQ